MTARDLRKLPTVVWWFDKTERDEFVENAEFVKGLEDCVRELKCEHFPSPVDWIVGPVGFDRSAAAGRNLADLDSSAPPDGPSVVFCPGPESETYAEWARARLLRWAETHDARWVGCEDVMTKGLFGFIKTAIIPWFFAGELPPPLDAVVVLIAGTERTFLLKGERDDSETPRVLAELKSLLTLVSSPDEIRRTAYKGQNGPKALDKVAIFIPADMPSDTVAEVNDALGMMSSDYRDKLEIHKSDSADNKIIRDEDTILIYVRNPDNGENTTRSKARTVARKAIVFVSELCGGIADFPDVSPALSRSYWINFDEGDGKKPHHFPFKIDHDNHITVAAPKKHRPFWIAFLLLCFLKTSPP